MTYVIISVLAVWAVVFTVLYWQKASLARRQQDTIGFFERLRKVQQNQIEANKATIKSIREEQQNLARELHDNVATTLSYLEVQFQNFLTADSGQSATYLKNVKELLVKAQTDTRQLAHSSVQPGKQVNLVKELRVLLEYCEVEMGLQTSLIASPHLELPQRYQPELLSSLRELIHNGVRHSGARVLMVGIYQSESSVQITVSDDGGGFDTRQPPQGMGLNNVKTRLRRIGALFTLSSSAAHGTIYQIYLKSPIENENDEAVAGR